MYIRESWLEKYSRFCSVKACLSALGSGSSTVCLPLSLIFGFIGRYTHYCPGPLATYIVNMDLIPVLQYRLQVTYIHTSKLVQIDSKIRSLIRRKYQLPPSTPTSLLYSSTGNIKLFHLESILTRNMITDSMVHIKSSNITSKVFHYFIDFFSRWAKLPQSLIVCPIPWTTLKD